MSLSTNFPTIKPSLLLDFANSRQLDPRVSFTRASIGTYFDATGVMRTATAGVPRFDYNPSTLESLGLLVEEARTNIVAYGQGLGASGFVPTGWAQDQFFGGLNVSSGTSVSVGSLGLYQFVVSGTTTLTNRMLITPTGTRIAVSGSTTYVFSYYVQITAGSYPYTLTPSFLWYDAGGSLISAPNGSAITPTTTLTRFTQSITSPSNAATVRLRWDFTGYSTIGTAVNFTMRLGGVQMEAGSFATSYIPTTAGSVARSAEALTMAGANFSSWYRSDEGTIYIDLIPKALAASSGVVINDNTTDNRIRVTLASATDQATVTTSASEQAVLDGGTPAANTAAKVAMAYKANDFALSLNGGAAATDTSGTVPTVTQLQIGAETTTIGNVTLKKLAYYQSRLSNANLQALTS